MAINNERSKIWLFSQVIKGGTEWTFKDSKYGTTAISLPVSYNELIAIVRINNNSLVQFTFTIPKTALGNSYVGFRDGYYSGSTSYNGCDIQVKSDTIHLQSAISGSADVTNNTAIFVYYR